MLYWHGHQYTPPVNGYTIPSTRTDGTYAVELSKELENQLGN